LALRPILTADRPVLRQRAKPVQRVDAVIRKLLDDMLETTKAAPGVGLAAPQVGVSVRVIVVDFEEQVFKLVNPEIPWASSATDFADEGCLSIPGYIGKVERHTKIRVRAKDLKGKPVAITADGWLARIFQHEIDHLDGILYTDRMAPGERLRPAVDDEDAPKEGAPLEAAAATR
jgi:peptide deformylase